MSEDGVLTKPFQKSCKERTRTVENERGRLQGVTDDAARGGMDDQLVPLEMYDSARAKIAANLSWLFSKAFGTDDVPSDLQDPFYTDQYEQEHIKPSIIHLLLSSELYCIVCSRLLQPEHANSLQNHTSVLQFLSKKGIYVLDDNNTLISELDLTSAPIKMGCHIHLIDVLMMAYTQKIVSIEKVMSTVKCFSETEVPVDLETAMVLWLNEMHYRKDLSGRSHQPFIFLDNLSNLVCNCTALLAAVHFYCPELIRREDICLKETPSVTESLYNIELLKKFSDEFLNKCFHLKPEDMLYSPSVLKSNMMHYVAELFWTFEIVKPDFMQPRDISEIKDARARPNPPEHRVWTLNSKNTIARAASSEICFKTSTNSSVLPRCQKEHGEFKDHTIGQKNWSHSTTHPSGQQSTTFPWSMNRQRSLSQTAPNPLNFPTKEDASSIHLSKHSLASNFMGTTPKHMLGSGHPHRLSGQSLLNHIRFEDEEEEIEEEELVAIIDPSTLPRRHNQGKPEQKDFNCSTSAPRSTKTRGLDACLFSTSQDKYYLEPLMPAFRKPAKEKSVNVKKEEERGESDSKEALRKTNSGSGALHKTALQFDSKYMSNASLTVLRAATQDSSEVCHRDRAKPSHGFYLHLLEGPKSECSLSSLEASNDSDSDIENFSEDNENELQLMGNIVSPQERYYRKKQSNFGDGESAKLGEDLNVNEWDDKEDHSGCSSPCLSAVSGSSSCNTPCGIGVKMTSFAERRRVKLGRDGLSSASTTPKATPDRSEAVPCQPLQMKNSSSLDKELCAVSKNNVTVPSEFLELHMELEERRHIIECQKKKMETLSAQQRQTIGKAAFLNIIKKEPGRSGTLPMPLKQESSRAADQSKVKIENCKDDSCLEALKKQKIQNDEAGLIRDNNLSQDSGQNLNMCSSSIEVLNKAIATIQLQLMQLSKQQDILIKHSYGLPSKLKLETERTPANPSTGSTAIVNFVNIDDSSTFSCQPKLSSSYKASSRKQKVLQIRDNKENGEVQKEVAERYKRVQDKGGNGTFEDCSIINQECAQDKTGHSSLSTETSVNSSCTAVEEDQNSKLETQTVNSETEASDIPDKSTRMKGQLIEVALSETRKPIEHSCTDAENEQKNVGFFFKDEDRADEMAKRRAAFLIKQQRKAEDAKLRKQQQEAESEQKRDETRRKAEEDRIRKEEEKARREFIKQEYLRKKQQVLIEEQGMVKSLPRARSRKTRPKSLHREGPPSLFKGIPNSNLSNSRRGSTLSMATEVESIISVESQGAESVCSLDFPVLSRTSSRNMERDWENGSIASSITSTEYNGPKLFKEPSSKSNKPIITNAIIHCCLAGKVNETQKNVILEELDKCESSHLFILFRDGGCQFRAIYSYSPDTEEITKVTGTGPRKISPKMIDKLYKYSSDRKQFSIIPAKSVSVSIDALTIHNHFWHVQRPGSARRK